MMPVRRLGYAELRMYLMHSLLCGTTQAVRAIRVRGPLQVAAIYGAVDDLRRAHDMLGVVLVEHDGDYWLAQRGENADSDVVVRQRAAGETLVDVLQRELKEPLDLARQTWRLLVLTPTPEAPHDYDLVLTFCHAVMDAGGSDGFFDELLMAASDADRNAQSMERRPVPPAVESICATTCSWEHFVGLQKELATRSEWATPRAHKRSAPMAERSTSLAVISLASERFGAIKRLCEREAVSVNSYLAAAFLSAVRDCSPDRSRFALGTAISLRSLCPGIRENDFGCYLSVVPTFHEVQQPPAGLAALAREYQRAVHKVFISHLRPPADYAVDAVRAAISNLSTSNTFVNDHGFTYSESRMKPSYGGLHVTDMYVAANRQAGNCSLVLMGVSLGEKAFFTLSHVEPIEDSAWAASVAAALTRRLLSPEASGSIRISGAERGNQ